MAYIVAKYQCRFGNNLRQILNACIEAHKAQAHNLIIPQHWRFKKTDILIHGNNSKIQKRGRFFHPPNNPWFMNKARKMVEKYLQDLLWVSPEKPNTDQIVMHVRSGDIFRKGGASHNYFQPPYSYYLKCIEATEKQSILVVTEKDMKNPIISQLEKDFSNNITIQASSIGEDVKSILEAEDLVIAKSTFSRMLSLFCPYLKKAHCPFWRYQKSDENGIISAGYRFPGYRSGKWRNTIAQRRQMMDYPIDKILKI